LGLPRAETLERGSPSRGKMVADERWRFMNAQQLRHWLLQQAGDIQRFTDYQIVFESHHELMATLGTSWFSDVAWNEPRYSFVSLGQDGSGGMIAVWLASQRPDSEPIVFFGSEGGAGVIAESPLRFAQALAYAPLLLEYEAGDLDAPSRLSCEDNWYLQDEDRANAAEARDALSRYRRSVEERLGPLPAFESLVAVPGSLQSEFREWVTAVLKRVSERDAEERQLAAAHRRQELREKASRFAAQGAAGLPANAASFRDGHQFSGVCASCGASACIRWTHFEEFKFGLCMPCYFSSAW